MSEAVRVITVGTKLRFADEQGTYIVRAIAAQYAIATRKSKRKVWYYTILDMDQAMRGPHNLVFNLYELTSKGDFEKCLADLISGKIELSRRSIPLEFAD